MSVLDLDLKRYGMNLTELKGDICKRHIVESVTISASPDFLKDNILGQNRR
jgi:hypothetical protein